MKAPPEKQRGTLFRDEHGQLCVRFERQLPYSTAQVWSAITEPEKVAQWAPGMQVEAEHQGCYQIWFADERTGPPHATGEVAKCIPGRTLALASFEYSLSEQDQGCRLVFTDVLNLVGQRSQADIVNAVLAGWHRYLDHLEDSLAGRNVEFETPEFDYALVDVDGRE